METNEILQSIEELEYLRGELDLHIIQLIPDLRRREATPRAMQDVDNILDMRNVITDMIGELLIKDLQNERAI